MQDSKIEWTNATWNPTRGCQRVSPGCLNCYAEVIAARFSDPGFWGHGIAKRTEAGGRWTRKAVFMAAKLSEPLRMKKPSRIFVNSTSDLFWEKFSNEEIAAVFGVMAMAPQHTFQVLTKRAERMRDWFSWLAGDHRFLINEATRDALGRDDLAVFPTQRHGMVADPGWPLPNVWLGVSVEDQQRADERISELLATPAAVRFLSCEPLLEAISLDRIFGLKPGNVWAECLCAEIHPKDRPCLTCESRASLGQSVGLHWAIIGGESGTGARSMELAWAHSLVEQFRAAGVATFVKQLGADPRAVNVLGGEPHPLDLKSKKGGDPSEWPAALRVREFPKTGGAPA